MSEDTDRSFEIGAEVIVNHAGCPAHGRRGTVVDYDPGGKDGLPAQYAWQAPYRVRLNRPSRINLGDGYYLFVSEFRLGIDSLRTPRSKNRKRRKP